MSYSPYDLPANQDPALRNLPENAPQSGLTLGQGNPQGGGPAPQPGYIDNFHQNLAMIQQELGGAERQYLPPTDPPSLFRNIFTFGQAGIDYHNYLNKYNQGVDLYNRGLKLKQVELAKEMTDSHERSQALSNAELLKQAQFTLALAGYKERLRHNQAAEGSADLHNQIQLNKPPSLEEEEMGEAAGRPWHPGSGFLPRRETGGWGDPAAEGSAFDTTVRRFGGGGGETTAAPDDAGLTPAQKIRKQRTQAEAEKTTATTKAKNDLLMTEAIDGLRRELDPIRESANLILPKLGKGGLVAGAAKSYLGGPASLAKARFSGDP